MEHTGLNTKLGQLGKTLLTIRDEPSPLQKQITSFVRKMFLAGFVIFILVCLVSYFNTHQIFASLLKGLTMAMSILPEEIPVAFATFMALGSRRLIHQGVLVKTTRIVETLGSATVICTDKTGTITENKMSLAALYDFTQNKLYDHFDNLSSSAENVLEIAMWASETQPFDPMEQAIHATYANAVTSDKRMQYFMVHEYPLSGEPPMMTHIFENEDKEQIIATKGAPEAIMDVSQLLPEEKTRINEIANQLAIQGLRILGVGQANPIGSAFPAQQNAISFHFLGLIAFQDPPKENIGEVFNQFYDAGLKVKIITGDNALTTAAIAKSTGLKDSDQTIDGLDLMRLTPDALDEMVLSKNIFTRMFPEAKLSTIYALQRGHEIVAMIGDGVNDGPALKAANIGIAMGRKGTELAKSAADLILMNDDLSTLVDAIAAGRRVYTNLKKAVQYIISIHIPIILTVSLPIFLGWKYPSIFTPVHVIFLELLMGPTCSIVYENEPIEKNLMKQPPRPASYSFLNLSEMGISILQGIFISAGIIFIYQYAVWQNAGEELTRTLVFTTLILANIFLTLVNRSFYFSFIESMKNINRILVWVIMISVSMLLLMLFIPPVRSFFQLAQPSLPLILVSMLTSTVTVFWFEIWKWNKRRISNLTFRTGQ